MHMFEADIMLQLVVACDSCIAASTSGEPNTLTLPDHQKHKQDAASCHECDRLYGVRGPTAPTSQWLPHSH